MVGMGNAERKVMDPLIKSGYSTHERIAEFPFWEEYGEQMKSDIADLKNILLTPPTDYMINGLDVVSVDAEMTYNNIRYNPPKDLIKWNRVWNYITTIEK